MKKILMFFVSAFILTTSLFADEIKIENRVSRKTDIEYRLLPRTNSIKLELDYETYEGEIIFKVIDSKNNIIFENSSMNNREFKTFLNLNKNESYKVQMDFKNFTGEYEFEIETY